MKKINILIKINIMKKFIDFIYKNYIKYGNDFGTYYCRKCSEHKRKKSLQMSYGVEYPIQNKKILKKMKQTITERKKEV
jgi:hypothetical protein